jgi:hypothetical protein
MAAVSDQLTVDALERVMQTANRLETGAMIFLVALAVLGVVAFLIWGILRTQRDKQVNRRLELEQAAKTTRAETYAAALGKQAAAVSELAGHISGLRRESINGVASIKEVLNEHDIAQRSREIEQVKQLSDVFTGMKGVMNEIVDRLDGAINIDDSIRIIEDCFERSVKPQAFSIAEQSLRTNHWNTDSVYIEERVMTELSSMIYHLERSLSNYRLRVDHRLFFGSNGGSDVAKTLWAIIRTLHQESLTTGPDGLSQRLGTAKIRLNNAINTIFNEGKNLALRAHRGPHQNAEAG